MTATPDDFLIVGLGASAGGIKAFRKFFEQVPVDSGLAYVVVLHLSPEYESRLAEVLQRSSAIPVTQVENRVRVERNHVYVLPPNQSLSMVDGHLALSPVTRIEERRAPIDIFFRTLAESKGPRAASVVLSGTGADGSMGMKRVKERGGVCFVQDPNEAEHEDMPRHSIATGLVDYVLPVADIPAKLLAYSAHRGALPVPPESAERAVGDDDAMRDIFTHLRVRTGHDFSSYKPATILRRLDRRMGLHEIASLPAYAEYLRSHPDEPRALLKDLLISVTNFFRDPEAFAALERLIPAMLEGKGPNDEVRVWVAACATGEEAYSIAMLLAEHTWDEPGAPRVQVFATDVDAEAIASAREGIYTINDAADVPPERLARFFVETPGGYQVRKELRAQVLFAQHNLIKDPPFSHLELVSCRNLLIYLNRTVQRRVMQILHFAVEPGGLLFLGSSESIEGSSDLFMPLDKDARLFESRGLMSRSMLTIPDIGRPNAVAKRPAERHPADARRAERLSFADLHEELLEQYAPPSVLIDENHEIVHLSPRAGRYLRFGGGEPSHNLLRAVRPELRVELRTALYQAAQRRTAVEAQGLSIEVDEGPQTVTVTVKPVLRAGDPARGFFLVLFQAGPADFREPGEAPEQVGSAGSAARQLEEELLTVRAQLRSTVEQYETQTEELKASNEELQAINEELRSSAEELEISKEELQSVNEELTTVNQELKIKIEEETQATNDILNLVNSTDIGTLFIDRESRIKLFTPRVRDVFSVIASDLGRPLSDIASTLEEADLSADLALVLDRLQSLEREVRARHNRWYLMRLIPYRTADNRIDGVVLTFVEITERKGAEQDLVEAIERLRMAAVAAGMFSWALDLDSRTYKYYTTVEPVLGFPLPSEVDRAAAYLHPEDRHIGAAALEEAVLSGGEFGFEQRFVNPAGVSVWTRTTGVVLRDVQGRAIRAVGTTQNIDQRQHYQHTLRSAHDELESRVEARTRELADANAALGVEVDERRAGEERVKSLLKRLVTIQEDERRRIARDLHDHLGQQTTALRLNLDALKTASGITPELCERVERVDRIATRLDAEVEFLAWELRPAGLDDIGLPGTLSKFLREWSDHYGIAADFHASGLDEQRLGPEIETCLYRITQEALNNVFKHARAGRVDVLLERRDGQVVLIVEDDGVGFEPGTMLRRREDRGMGLIGMRERAALAGGKLEIESEIDKGTTIFVWVPLTDPSREA
jgi:two-component system CheB/CheR fusion protein